MVIRQFLAYIFASATRFISITINAKGSPKQEYNMQQEILFSDKVNTAMTGMRVHDITD